VHEPKRRIPTFDNINAVNNVARICHAALYTTRLEVCMGMNRALIGKTYTSDETFDITAENAGAYAAATLAHIDAYPAVSPPMFGVCATFAMLGTPLFDPELEANMMRLVHGEQDMTFLDVIKPGDKITARSTIQDIVEKPTGELLQIAITATNQHGTEVLRSVSGLFIRGSRKRDGGFDKRPDTDVVVPTALWTEELVVADDQAKRYADASGDHNPIHVDEEMAKMAGLPACILHGLCGMAFMHNALVRRHGGAPSSVERLSVRFLRPVLMGDVLSLSAHEGGTVDVKNQHGNAVLAGQAWLR
jgi:(3R)-3-hydroxyacyl-CoA dehydrogenase / 3a,7a,12a-trihydroxy-5b-cholest-24-enoyl-CoA hydratase / enoyl-CoA hydratase 2